MINAQKLLKFIENSPSCFHAVTNISKLLTEKGFSELYENQKWSVEEGKSYFVRRNNSSIIAFKVPQKKFSRFLIVSSHSDSPSFKIKENPEIVAEGTYVKLNVEKYGGMLCAPWFDRPLSVAGRLILKTGSPMEFREELVCIDEDLLIIPNLAIHMNRDANSGTGYNVQNDMLPVFSCNREEKLLDYVIKAAGLKPENVQGNDLFLYCRTPGTFVGADKGMISAPKLDDLECAWTTLQGFLDSENDEAASVYCVFDNEEVGSLTRQGADSTFMEDVLRRLNTCLGRSEEDFLIAIAESFMVSADNAHAAHPNYGSSADPINRPKLNGGPVIKFNAAQKYTTDGVSSAMFKSVCEKAGVPFQYYTNRSDIAGGSTLGNLSNAHISLRCVDIGLAQWAMHSPYETGGSRDVDYMIKAISSFYSK